MLPFSLEIQAFQFLQWIFQLHKENDWHNSFLDADKI